MSQIIAKVYQLSTGHIMCFGFRMNPLGLERGPYISWSDADGANWTQEPKSEAGWWISPEDPMPPVRFLELWNREWMAVMADHSYYNIKYVGPPAVFAFDRTWQDEGER